MRFFESVPPSRRLLALFLALTVAPAAGLVWLGWRLLEQDRALETQRALERQDHVADLVVSALSRQIALSRESLTRSGDTSPVTLAPDAVIVAEPTQLDVVVAHKGVVRWRCHTRGRAAHSATQLFAPAERISAIIKP